MTYLPWRGYWSEFSRNVPGMKKTILVTLIVFFAAGPALLTNAQSHRWSKLQGRRLVKFDWGCATPSVYPSAKLNRIVKLVMKRNDYDGLGTWGDRAFRFDLNGDQRPEYFVPLDCGGTGNCVWGVFAVNPARELGLITGQDLYVHRLKGQWPEVVTYSHLSAVEGSLTTYRFRKRHYSQVGTQYPVNHGNYDLDIQGGAGNKMPAFLERRRQVARKRLLEASLGKCG
jgi:hypothetical protein